MIIFNDYYEDSHLSGSSMKLQDFFKKALGESNFFQLVLWACLHLLSLRNSSGRSVFEQTEIKGHCWLRNLGEKVSYIPKQNSAQRPLSPSPAPLPSWSRGGGHRGLTRGSWEAGDHPYLDVPVIMWSENGGESVFPVNGTSREMLRRCNGASFSFSR